MSCRHLGRYYSRGMLLRDLGPRLRRKAFERMIWVDGDMRLRRMSLMIREANLEEMLLGLREDDLGALRESVLATTARLAVAGRISLHDDSRHSNGDSGGKKKL